MKNSYIYAIIILIIIMISIFKLFSEEMIFSENATSERFLLNSSNTHETDLSFRLDKVKYHYETKNGTDYLRLQDYGTGEYIEIGKPEIPKFSKLIAIPDNSDIYSEILSFEEEIIENIVLYPKQTLSKDSSISSSKFEINEKYYNTGDVFPKNILNIDEPAILRDYRVVNVTVNPFRYDPIEKKLYIIKEVDFKVHTSGVSDINCKNITDRKKSRIFEEFYKSSILNYDQVASRNIVYQNPSYLFVYPNSNEVANVLESLVQWKHEKGFEVYAASTQETGISLNSIKSFIQNAYDNWINPPEFVCLVGDAGGSFSIPTDHMDGGMYNGEGDQFYSLLEGDDILADVFLGRLSFNDLNEFQTIVNKTVNYEKNPYLNNEEWYTKMLLVGDPTDSGPSTITTNLYIKEMIENNYPEFEFDEVYQNPWTQQMSSSLNNGASYFHYRGFANMSGWDLYHINNLNNGFMLPFVTHITCITGDFEGTFDCRSEAFLKAGTPGTPQGAIGAVGTATGNTHTCFNNIVSAGIFEGIFNHNIHYMGGALAYGKYALFENYPGNPANAVVQFSYWNNLMGDPGVELWTAVPQPINAIYESSIPLGSDQIEIEITDESGTPLENAWVTILKGDDEIFANDYTDNNGKVYLPISSGISGNVTITASKHNSIPLQETFTIEETTIFVNTESMLLDDDTSGASNGNNDFEIGSNETIEASFDLHNFGSTATSDLNLSITCENDFITFQNLEIIVPSLQANSSFTTSEPIIFSVGPNISGGEEVFFDVNINDQNGNIWYKRITKIVYDSNLILADQYILDENNLLEPGETADLIIELGNIGTNLSGDFQVALSCDDNNVSIANPVVSYSSINPDENGDNVTEPFIITTNHQIYNGSMININLNLINQYGEIQNYSFLLEVGEVSIEDPLGPDSFGYYFYDDGDTGIQEVPEYLWFEIDPDFGGNGNDLQLNDPGNTGDIEYVTLPFNLKFYNHDYNEITVCSNGWIAPGITEQTSFMNWQIPGTQGPSPIIAPFWDDLITGNGKVLSYYNESAHTFIIEWSRVQSEYNNTEETFQLIIYDTEYYPTSNENNKILFQYQVVNNVDQGVYGFGLVAHGQYATVGIEDHTGNHGLLYTYNDEYPTAAKPLQNEMAILLSPEPIIHDDAYLVIDDFTIQNDDNEDGEVDFSETFDLFINLVNLGQSTAQNINCNISTEDEHLTIHSDQSSYNDIDASFVGSNLTPFSLEADGSTPDGHIATVLVNVLTIDNEWDLILNIRINAPNIVVDSYRILDGNNGILDPGENADLVIDFKNIGGCDASNVNSIISCTNIFIGLGQAQFFFEDFATNDTQSAVFEISSETNAPISLNYLVNIDLTGDNNYINEIEQGMYIAQYPVQVYEPFDQFPPMGWVIDGDNWFSSNSDFVGGNPPEMAFVGFPFLQGSFRFISPIINTRGSIELNLSFRELLDNLTGGYIVGIQTTKDGENWNTLWERNAANVNPILTEIVLQSPDIGSENFQFAFYFEGDTQGINAWVFDNAELTEVPITPHSYISGNVTISDDDVDLRQILISAGEFVTTPDENGYYCLSTHIGTYDVKASYPGFISDIHEDVEIAENWQTVNIDFELNELSMENTPENFTVAPFGDRILLDWEVPGFNGRSSSKDLENKENLKSMDFSKNERDLTGYNIYKNGEFLANIIGFMTTEYMDQNNPDGQYSYYVTALYDEGESIPTEVIEIDYELPAPQNIEASVGANNAFVLLAWDSPENCPSLTGFRVYRDGEFLQLTTAHFLVDNSVTPGFHIYEVTARYGNYESQPAEVTIEFTETTDGILPLVTELKGNYPNPFNPETEIKFSIRENEHVILEIYNIKGEKVNTLVNEKLEPGYYIKSWQGKDKNNKKVSSGIYFYRLKMPSYSSTRKMLMLK